MPIIKGAGKVGTNLGEGVKKIARGRYSFAADGGTVGDKTLREAAIPAGAVVTDCFIKVNTALASGGAATVAVKVESTADVQAAAAVSGAPWSTTGVKRASALDADAAPVVATAARSIVASVAVAALTAGSFDVVVEYLELAP